MDSILRLRSDKGRHSRGIIVFGEPVVIEGAAVAVAGVHVLEQSIAACLGALPHAPLEHAEAGGRNGRLQLIHRHIV